MSLGADSAEFGADRDRDAKEAENVRHHGVTFSDALVALRDPFAIEWFDEVANHRLVRS